MFVSKQQLYVPGNNRATNVGLYCMMSVVLNAMTASQLKRVNNFIFTDIVTYRSKHLLYPRLYPNGS